MSDVAYEQAVEVVRALSPEDRRMVMAETARQELTQPDFGDKREALMQDAGEISREQVLEETRAFIAHELRNALLPIDILNEMQRKALAQGKLDERKTAEFTEIISKQSSRMHRLVNRYLEYAQPFMRITTGTGIASPKQTLSLHSV